MGDLMEELAKERKNIKTDSYDMSIGEIISLYQDGDLKLNPAYQRLYRWDKDHKVRFIESILIGIPIPEIFVAQKEALRAYLWVKSVAEMPVKPLHC